MVLTKNSNIVFALLVMLFVAGSALAQDSSLFLAGKGEQSSLMLENSSFLYQEMSPDAALRELRLHDIVKIIVDYRSTTLSEGDAENRRVTNLNAVLSDWLGFDGKNLFPAPQSRGDLRINGQLNSQFRTEADMNLRDALTFVIGAEIVDIRPNGNLVLQADREINVNEEVWKHTLTGEVSRQAIGMDRTVRSDDLIHLRISKQDHGFVRDGYARGWFTRWYDKWKPF